MEDTTSAPLAAIETRGLGKVYRGRTRALVGVDLRVEQGDVFGLLGQNGAGKTTLIRILLDMIRPTGGGAAILGHDVQRDGVEARRHVGYLPSSAHLYGNLNTLDLLALVAGMRDVDLDDAYVGRLIERLELDPKRAVRTLSRGNQQKVGLVVALAAKPELVILDEPTSGLDPLVQEEVLDIVREVAAEGRTVFFSSHILPEIEEICNRAAVLRAGEQVGVFDLAAQRRIAARHVTATFDAAPDAAAFEDLPAVRVVAREGRRVTFELSGDIDPLVKRLARYHVTNLEARAPTLEDFFFTLYRGDTDEAADDTGTVGP